MEMAQLLRVSVILLCFSLVLGTEASENDIVRFVLDSNNRNPDSRYVYNTAKIINSYKKNDSEPLFFLQLEVDVSCNTAENCNPSPLICEVGIKENPSTNSKEILTEKTKCVKKELDPVFPTSGHGFTEGNITDEIRRIAAFAVQQAEIKGDKKRSIIDVMSVKKQIVGNATTLYLTLKVATNEGGDAAQFEVCEAEMNQTGELAWESDLVCFPLNRQTSDSPINAEEITTVAERASDEMDSLSYSEYTLKLVDVLKAESMVTPGSQGTLSNLEIRLAPTLCLKNVDIENDSYGLYEKRLCPENLSSKRMVCSLISWDRPWLEDTLYSNPVCYEDVGVKQAENQNETTESVNADAMLNDQVEPENVDSTVTAVEHHSIPVVEELDPIVEQILPNNKEQSSQNTGEQVIPVVEEPFVSTQVHCDGCAIELDVSNPALDEFVDQALAVIDEGSYGQHMHKATKITRALKQVVNGVKYILHLEVAETSCLKGSGQDRTTCEPSNSEVKTCIVEFLEKPWLDSSRVIISNNCTLYNNDLENEIEPHINVNNFLNAVNEPETVHDDDLPSYGKDGLYMPEDEPEYHPVESEVEEFDVRNPGEEPKILEKTEVSDESSTSPQDEEGTTAVPTSESEESIESGKGQMSDKKKKQSHSDDNISSEEQKDVHEKEKFEFDEISSFLFGENRKKRETKGASTVGSLKDIIDSERDLVNKLAQIAVKTLDEIDEDDKKRVVLEVTRAQKQLVNGILYHLQMRVASTSCSESGESKPDCIKNHVLPVKICKVQLHRTFANNAELDAKVVKSECSAENDVPAVKKSSRNRRDVGIVTGGLSPANTSDPYILGIANFGVSELDKGTNSLYSQCVVRIISAHKQVVAGYNVYLTMEVADSVHRKGESVNGTCQQSENSEHKICHVTVWHRPWIANSEQLTAFNCSSASTVDGEELGVNRKKRNVDSYIQDSLHRPRRHFVGGPVKADENDPYIQEMTNTALAEFDRRSNALYKQKVVRVVEAHKQVVAGVLTKLTLEIGYSNCRKGIEKDVALCDLKEDSNNQICYAEVWDRPWLNKREVRKMSCTPASEKRMKRKSPKKGDLLGAFHDFLGKYNKKYSSQEEYKRRYHIFRANLKKIDLLQKTEKGTGRYGVTQFADLSTKEFKKFHLGLNMNLKNGNEVPMKEAEIPDVELPKEFDWRHYNAVTEVKNQGACGSCWAFSVTGNIEGQWAIKKGKLWSLSEQELVDCDTLDDGCNGGLPENAYKAIEQLGGLETEKDYPYEGEDEKCSFNNTEIRVTIEGAVNVTKNETKMAQWLYKNGPLSIGINANAMQFYVGGVSHPWKFLCSKDNLDHGVLIVGFGVHKTSILHKTLPYWIVKNSWGTFWGEKGYYRVYRGDGTCGVNQMVTSAVVA